MNYKHEAIFWLLSTNSGYYLKMLGREWMIILNGLIVFRAKTLEELGEEIAEKNDLKVYIRSII